MEIEGHINIKIQYQGEEVELNDVPFWATVDKCPGDRDTAPYNEQVLRCTLTDDQLSSDVHEWFDDDREYNGRHIRQLVVEQLYRDFDPEEYV